MRAPLYSRPILGRFPAPQHHQPCCERRPNANSSCRPRPVDVSVWPSTPRHSPGAMATAPSGHVALRITRPRRVVDVALHTTAQKKRRPISSGRGLRGGRWPGAQVERDGSSCYCGRGWVSDGPTIAGRQRLVWAGSLPPGLYCLPSDTRSASDRFISVRKKFFMAIFPADFRGHGRLP